MVRARSAAVVAAIVAVVGPDEALLAVALALIAIGFSKVWLPGAYLVPGFVLLWIVMPARAPFIARPPVSPQKPDRRALDAMRTR